MEKVKCLCGCGKERDKFDVRGRQRYYLVGHAPKLNLNIWNKGKKDIYSDETLLKMRNKKLGKKLSKDHVKKIADANRKNTQNENYKMKQARWKTKKIELKPCCEICGSTENLQKHHWRYDKPLLVNTLCKTCHTIQHIKHFEDSKYSQMEVTL